MKTQGNTDNEPTIYYILDAMDDCICITNDKNNIVYSNPALCRRAGLTQEQMQGTEVFWGIFNPNESEKSDGKLFFRNAWSARLNCAFDITITGISNQAEDKRWMWIAKELPQTGDTGGLPQITTPGNLAKDSIDRTLFDNTPSGILLLDEKGIILDVNNSTCKSTNYEKGELIGQYVGILALPENAELVQQNIKRILDGEILEQEVTSRRKDGSYYYSLLVESAVQLPNGKRGILSISNDITIRKLALMALQESEEKFRNIANYTANWESLFNHEGKIVWSNPAAERFTGYSPEEIIAMPDFVSVIISEEFRDEARKSIQQGLMEKTGTDAVFKCKRKNGSYFWLSVSWNQIHDNNGILIGVRTSGQDVTKQIEAHEKLQHSESLFRQMVENAPIGMHFYELDENENLIFSGANPAADRILNLDHSRLTGKPMEKVFPNLKGTDVPIFYTNAAKNNITWITEQINYQDNRISGVFEVKAFQTAPNKMVATFSDITQRKKTEIALNESRILFETLTRMAPVGIFRTNAKGDTTYVNAKWCEITGLSYEEALDGKYLTALHPEDIKDRIDEWQNAVRTKTSVTAEYRFIQPNGTIIWVHGQAVPEIVEGEMRGFIGTLTDITELIDTQHELIRAKEKAEASNRLIIAFMKSLSHEIRTPLNGILGFAQLISSGGYSQEENEEFVGFLDKNIERLTTTIDNIMKVSLMAMDNMAENQDNFEIDSLARGINYDNESQMTEEQDDKP